VAQAGERFVMPDGSAYVVRRPAAETEGREVEMEFVLPSGCVPPPLHVHDSQVEAYEVLEGEFDVVIDGVWRTLRPGDTASVPVGASHTFRNRSGAPVRVRNWHRPALRFEAFIERTCATLRDDGVRRKRDPRVPLLLSHVMLAHEETLRVARRRERWPMRALGALGGLWLRARASRRRPPA
jgi:mannose-6-phosphate isomerase-like protein (cupin superfamily)